MVPSREIFWNIQYGEILYLLAAIVIGILIYGIYRHYKLWRLGGPEDRFSHIGRRIWAFLVTGVVDGILHRKFFGVADGLGHRPISVKDFLPREFYPGVAHFIIFIGCIGLVLSAFLDFISHYFFHFMHGGFYLAHSIGSDVSGLLVLLGVILVMVRHYVQKPDRLDNKADDLIAFLFIFLVVVTGFVVEG